MVQLTPARVRIEATENAQNAENARTGEIRNSHVLIQFGIGERHNQGKNIEFGQPGKRPV